MNIGERTPAGSLVQTQRTKAKLEENFAQLTEDIEKRIGPLNQDCRMVIYNALLWTADDVLQQAVDDGYSPSAEYQEIPPGMIDRAIGDLV